MAVIKDHETCTQAERDEKFGKGWRWNTRNCTLLKPKVNQKRCKKDKLKKCIEREAKKNKILESLAKLKCKALRKKNKNKRRDLEAN